jgi:L-ascorbate metabolism protein UlaG (beta-lactamase superfamily)
MMKIAIKNFLPALVLCMYFFFGTIICTAQTAHDSLTYYGHSFVKIKTAQGTVIYIDPYNVNAFTDSADIVLITHEHSDHNEINRVKQKSSCQVIRAANTISGSSYNTFTLGAVTITGVPAYNSYHAKSSCVGFVVSFNGIKLYHAGDTGNITEMADLTVQHITYALIPMDGIYTMTPEVATAAAATIQAVHDIPIHTMPPPDTYSDAIVGRFTSPNKLIVRPGSTIELSSTTTGVEKTQSLPSGLRLDQNFPNPFNPTTNIGFEIKFLSLVTLKVYDILGREAASIVSEKLSPGIYVRQWNASKMPSGVYFYRLQSGNLSETKRLIVTK